MLKKCVVSDLLATTKSGGGYFFSLSSDSISGRSTRSAIHRDSMSYEKLNTCFVPFSFEFAQSLVYKIAHVQVQSRGKRFGRENIKRGVITKFDPEGNDTPPFHFLYEDGGEAKLTWEEVGAAELFDASASASGYVRRFDEKKKRFKKPSFQQGKELGVWNKMIGIFEVGEKAYGRGSTKDLGKIPSSTTCKRRFQCIQCGAKRGLHSVGDVVKHILEKCGNFRCLSCEKFSCEKYSALIKHFGACSEHQAWWEKLRFEMQEVTLVSNPVNQAKVILKIKKKVGRPRTLKVNSMKRCALDPSEDRGDIRQQQRDKGYVEAGVNGELDRAGVGNECLEENVQTIEVLRTQLQKPQRTVCEKVSNMLYCTFCNREIQEKFRKSHSKGKVHCRLVEKARARGLNVDFCRVCGFDDDYDAILICDLCEGEYHMYCLDPALTEVPKGEWTCPSCSPAVEIGSSTSPAIVAIESNESLKVDDSFGKGDTSEISIYTDTGATTLPLPELNNKKNMSSLKYQTNPGKKRPRPLAEDSVSEAIISNPKAGAGHSDCQWKKVKCATPQEHGPVTTENAVKSESDEKERQSVADDAITENLNPASKIVLSPPTQRDGKDFNSVDPEMAEALIARALTRKRKKHHRVEIHPRALYSLVHANYGGFNTEGKLNCGTWTKLANEMGVHHSSAGNTIRMIYNHYFCDTTSLKGTEHVAGDNPFIPYKCGEKVKAKCPGWSKHYTGVIVKADLKHRTYSVLFADGERKKGVKHHQIIIKKGISTESKMSSCNDEASGPSKPPHGGCYTCQKDDDPQNVLLCDGCDAEYHLYCLVPPLKEAPSEDLWFCAECEKNGRARFEQQRRQLSIDLVKDTSDNCRICFLPDDAHAEAGEEPLILVCDACDGNYHGVCLNNPLKEAPEGDWFCHACVCAVGTYHISALDTSGTSEEDESSSEEDSETDQSNESEDSSEESSTDYDSSSEEDCETRSSRKHFNLLKHDNKLESVAVVGQRAILCLGNKGCSERKQYFPPVSGRILRWDEERGQHLVVISEKAPKWLDLRLIPTLITRPYLVWATPRGRSVSIPAEIFDPYGPFYKWFKTNFDEGKHSIIRFLREDSEYELMSISKVGKKSLYNADGSLNLRMRRVWSKELVKSLEAAKKETQSVFRIKEAESKRQYISSFRRKSPFDMVGVDFLVQANNSVVKTVQFDFFSKKHLLRHPSLLVEGLCGKTFSSPRISEWVDLDTLYVGGVIVFSQHEMHQVKEISTHDFSMEGNCRHCGTCTSDTIDDVKKDFVRCLKCKSTVHLNCVQPSWGAADGTRGGASYGEFVCIDCSMICLCCGVDRKQLEGTENTNLDHHRGWRLHDTNSGNMLLCCNCEIPYKNKQMCGGCNKMFTGNDLIDLYYCSGCKFFFHNECQRSHTTILKPETMVSQKKYVNWVSLGRVDSEQKDEGVSSSLPAPVLKSVGTHCVTLSAAKMVLSTPLNDVQFDGSKKMGPLNQDSRKINKIRMYHKKNELQELIRKKTELEELVKAGRATSLQTAPPHSIAHSSSQVIPNHENACKPTDNPSVAILVKSIVCSGCMRREMISVLKQLKKFDKHHLFYSPVTKEIAPTYFDVIESPMHLSLIEDNILTKRYSVETSGNPIQAFYDDFCLLVKNALIFNKAHTIVWTEAWRFFEKSMPLLDEGFSNFTFCCESSIRKEIDSFEKPRKSKKSEINETREKKEKLRQEEEKTNKMQDKWRIALHDEAVTNFTEFHPIPFQTETCAMNMAWFDLCSLCGSGGESLLFCVDCGEAFHYYCVNRDSHLEAKESHAWRCPNCQICELCGKTHDDESLVICDVCDLAFGMRCIYPVLAPGSECNFMCGTCVHCPDCKGSERRKWGTERNKMCESCSLAIKVQKEHDDHLLTNCRVCLETLDPDNDNTVYLCSLCNTWVHGVCDKNSELFASSPYTCYFCRPENVDGMEYGHLLSSQIVYNRVKCVQTARLHPSSREERSRTLLSVCQSPSVDIETTIGHANVSVGACHWPHLKESRLAGFYPSQSAVWVDIRQCVFCHTRGETGELGRFLPLPEYEWCHARCALLSSEIYEREDGMVVNIDKAVKRAKIQSGVSTCTLCGAIGATMGCVEVHCKHSYHFLCGKQANVKVSKDGTKILCSSCSASNGVNDYIELFVNDHRALRTYGSQEVTPALGCSPCLRIGALTLIKLGKVIPPTFHHKQKSGLFFSKTAIYPLGYTSLRIFWSTKRPFERCLYLCEVKQTWDERLSHPVPLFIITASDRANTDPDRVIQSQDLNVVYDKLLEKVNELYDCSNTAFCDDSVFSERRKYRATNMTRDSTARTYGLTGEFFFGFRIREICSKLETLPDAAFLAFSETVKYEFKYSTPTPREILMVKIRHQEEIDANATGARGLSFPARTRKFVVRSDIVTVLRKRSSGLDDNPLDCKSTKINRKHPRRSANEIAGINNESFYNLEVDYRKMREEPLWQRVQVKRSPIHRWGLFAQRDIDVNDMVIEYVGETINADEADRREKDYDLNHAMGGCYMFRIDEEKIVDATHKGNMARFMNHCCDPNCYAKVVTIKKTKHIIIFSLRKIYCGEEIVYDYQFPLEADAIKCNCGSINCIGRMN